MIYEIILYVCFFVLGACYMAYHQQYFKKKEPLKINVCIDGAEEVNNLIELLCKYFGNLPVELQNSIKDVAKYGVGDLEATWFETRFNRPITFDCSIYSVKQNIKIVSINKILKKVVICSDGKFPRFKDTYPESFWLKVDGNIVVEW